MSEKRNFSSIADFLNDDMFIAWRLFRTDETERYWEEFVREHPQAEPLLHEACRRFEAVRFNEKSRLHPETGEAMYRELFTRLPTHKPVRRRPTAWWMAAASLIFAVVSTISIIWFARERQQPTAPSDKIVGRTLPSEQVRLIAGDQTIELQSSSEITLSEKGRASVVDGTSVDAKALQLADDKPNQLLVPYGKRSFITLADGSRIWLNSGTELTFPAKFSGTSREVRLKGEIYIEVAPSDRPFLVHTPKAVVHVKGTRFNVSAYADEPTESVVLVSGSVQVAMQNLPPLTLAPDEMAAISSEGMIKKNVDASEYTSWHHGIIQFNRTSLTDVLRKIGRYYNVSFESSSDIALNGKTVSGKLFLSNNLDSVMTSLSVLSSTDYKREENQIWIRKKQSAHIKRH
ncbi:FecR family protein [Tannerella sp.]|uniref:FecR family protein n=1 Tax=Tannerella sp. TaxID=2382127 RepID=UPI0026DB8083|nr:FecR domain-containing protein [Tannerella sp.]MDO4702985.1 FecR domain-containing protein [Tannerella sp.]